MKNEENGCGSSINSPSKIHIHREALLYREAGAEELSNRRKLRRTTLAPTAYRASSGRPSLFKEALLLSVSTLRYDICILRLGYSEQVVLARAVQSYGCFRIIGEPVTHAAKLASCTARDPNCRPSGYRYSLQQLQLRASVPRRVPITFDAVSDELRGGYDRVLGRSWIPSMHHREEKNG